jgi:phosphoribosyl-ATP pyrophosphohydrolase
MSNIFEKIFKVIADRDKNPVQGSYTNTLLTKGFFQTAKKTGEEGVEVAMAAVAQDNDRLISEMADLWFHNLVLLYQKGLTPNDVLKELEKRHEQKK